MVQFREAVFTDGYPEAGTIVRVPWLVIRHDAVVTDTTGPDGHPMLLHNSMAAGEVREQAWSDVIRGKWRSLGVPQAPRDVDQALAAGRTMLGKPYAAFADNCEHFWREIYGLEKASPQLRGWIAAGAGLITAGLLHRLTRRGRDDKRDRNA